MYESFAAIEFKSRLNVVSIKYVRGSSFPLSVQMVEEGKSVADRTKHLAADPGYQVAVGQERNCLSSDPDCLRIQITIEMHQLYNNKALRLEG